MNNQQLITETLVNMLGVDPAEVLPDADFHLDLNATNNELMELKAYLEEVLEIQLDIDNASEFPETVSELVELVDDSCL